VREAAGPPEDKVNSRAPEELSKVVGLEAVEVAPNFSSADPSVESSFTRSESPMEENAPETSKLPEQSQNVIENKGPAAAEVHG